MKSHFKNISYQSDKDTINPDWDDLSVRYHYNFLENAIIRHVPEAKHVLDVGPGFGHWVGFFKKNYSALVEHVDVSPDVVCDVDVKHDVNGYCDSIVDFWVDYQYDTINAIGVLHHIMKDKDLAKAVANIKSMCTGTILIGTRLDFDKEVKTKNRIYRPLSFWRDLLDDFEIERSNPPIWCKKHLDLIIVKT